MHKILTSLFALAAVAVTAQTLPFTFESATPGMQGYDGATFTIVPNPSAVGNPWRGGGGRADINTFP